MHQALSRSVMPNWNFSVTAKTFPTIALVLGVFLIVIQQIG
jgi:hypothetical protein